MWCWLVQKKTIACAQSAAISLLSRWAKNKEEVRERCMLYQKTFWKHFHNMFKFLHTVHTFNFCTWSGGCFWFLDVVKHVKHISLLIVVLARGSSSFHRIIEGSIYAEMTRASHTLTSSSFYVEEASLCTSLYSEVFYTENHNPKNHRQAEILLRESQQNKTNGKNNFSVSTGS